MDKFILMYKDVEVFKYDNEKCICTVLNKSLLPFALKSLVTVPAVDEHILYKEVRKTGLTMGRQHTACIVWLAQRSLTINRMYAEKMYINLYVSDQQDIFTMAKLAKQFNGTSILDNYWVKSFDSKLEWKDVNVREATYDKALADIALHGYSYRVPDSNVSPEISTGGKFAKAWRKEKDGLYLHKRGWENGLAAALEVYCSRLLDKMNVNHLEYTEDICEGAYTCKCKCMTTDNVSVLTGEDFGIYCNANGRDMYEEALRIDAENIYKMWIVDYLLCNNDRHSLNWGFFYNSNTTEILGCHPLFDHNRAFDETVMQNPDADYSFDTNMTMREAALIASKKVDFHFTASITERDFMKPSHYKVFIERAKELGLMGE